MRLPQDAGYGPQFTASKVHRASRLWRSQARQTYHLSTYKVAAKRRFARGKIALPVSRRRSRRDSARYEDEDRELAITAVTALFMSPLPRRASTDLAFRSRRTCATQKSYLQSISNPRRRGGMATPTVPKVVGHEVTGHPGDRNSMMSPSNSVQFRSGLRHETRPRQRRPYDAGIGRPSGRDLFDHSPRGKSAMTASSS